MADREITAGLLEALRGFGDGRDLGKIEDAVPALTQLLADLATPDFECIMVGFPPTPPLHFPGLEGIAAAWRDYGEAFESVRADLEEVREGDDHLVLMVQQKAVTRHQGVAIGQPSAMVIAFEGDRVARLEFHLDRAEALRVAGLDR